MRLLSHVRDHCKHPGARAQAQAHNATHTHSRLFIMRDSNCRVWGEHEHTFMGAVRGQNGY